MKNFRKFKGSSRKILFESSIYMHPFFIYSYCESNRNTIDRKYRYSIRNELISFHACLEKKKVQKLEHPCPMWKISSEQPLFLRFLYLFIHYISEKVRIEISIEIFSHIIQPSTLNFIFLIFLRIFFFFFSFFIPSSRSCATLKYDRLRFIKRYALPPPEKNPSRRGCSLINNPLSVFFSFSFFFFFVLFIVLEPSSLHLVYLFILLFSLSPHRDDTGKRHTRPRGVLTRNTGPINTEIPSRNGFHARSRLFRIRLANDNALIPS